MEKLWIWVHLHDHRWAINAGCVIIIAAACVVNVAELPIWAIFTSVCVCMVDAITTTVYQLRHENLIDDVDDAVGCKIIWTSHLCTQMLSLLPCGVERIPIIAVVVIAETTRKNPANEVLVSGERTARIHSLM